jgi:CRISPR-associated protein Csb2
MDIPASFWAKGQEPRKPKRPQDLRTLKSVCPTHLRGGDSVHFVWALTQPDSDFEKHREALFAAARSITHLGWGIDLVAASAAVISEADAAKLPGERWLPTADHSAVGYRVSNAATLHALTERYEAFLTRLSDDGFNPVPPLSEYHVVAYRRSVDPPIRPFAALAFYEPDANRMRSFPATQAIAVAGMVRCLTGKMAHRSGHCDPGAKVEQWVDEYVMGHGEAEGLRPRFSYLPLPTIRPPDVLSNIRRVIIAEPPGGAGVHAAWVLRTLRGQLLVSEQQREEALLMSLRSDDSVLARYTAASETWATVTPVVLPGSDEGKFAKAERLFLKALRHAGYETDALAELEFRNASFWPGGDLALRFHRPDYLKKDYWSVYHVRLRWHRPIKGPLGLGAGRHCGLGIFAARSSEKSMTTTTVT